MPSIMPTRSTVMRQLDSLRKQGLITSESRRKLDEDGRSRQTSALYRIDMVGIALGKSSYLVSFFDSYHCSNMSLRG